MSDIIIRNFLNNLVDEPMQFIPMDIPFLKDFKAKICLFCSQSDVKFLCQCKNCGYYFCNNIHRKTSHIVLHLKHCKHSKIALPPFDSELKCEECQTKDVFSLYFKEKRILCRNCIKELDEICFTKIVEDKRINEDILMSPGIPPLANRIDSFTESLIYKTNQKINYMMKNNLYTINLYYESLRNYCKRYKAMLNIEIEELEYKIEMNEPTVYNLKFSEKETYVTAELNYGDKGFFFSVRQLLRVAKNHNQNKYYQARAVNIDYNSKKVTLFFHKLNKSLKDGNYSIKGDESYTNYSRMFSGLKDFKHNGYSKMDKNILSLILGTEINKDGSLISNINTYLDESQIPERLNILRLLSISLNQSQDYAIRNCFKHKLTLIKGPPGTGKSTVLLFLTYYLLKLISSMDKIYIGAPSNRAVDNISFLLQKLGINFVRVLSIEKETTGDVDKTNSLDDLIQKEIERDIENNKLLKKVLKKKKQYSFLKGKDKEEYDKIMGQYQFKILNSTKIVLSTLNNSSDERIKKIDFPIVIIDEATQALEPDCLLPLIHKAQMVVMIGDEKQLGPTIISEDNKIGGLGVSLFERLCYLYKGSDFICSLKEQYRGHESLFEFSNKHFYNNELINHGGIKLDENVKNNFPWPNKDIPMFFYHVEGTEVENEALSYYNEQEIYNTYGIVHKLEICGVDMKNIGIIAPYDAQKKKQAENLHASRFKDLQIESVDGFQGMEKDYIILSATRSNDKGIIGFLTSPKRLNVALTRAKKGVIIIGNAKCLSKKHSIWRDLIFFFASKKLIAQGPLHNLKLVPQKELFGDNYKEYEEFEDIKIEENKMRKKIKLIRDECDESEEAAPCAKIEKSEIKGIKSEESDNEVISTSAEDKDDENKYGNKNIIFNLNHYDNKNNKEIKNSKDKEKKHKNKNIIRNPNQFEQKRKKHKKDKINYEKEEDKKEEEEEKEDKKEDEEKKEEKQNGKKNKKNKRNQKEDEDKKEEDNSKKAKSDKKDKKNKKGKSPEKKNEDKKNKDKKVEKYSKKNGKKNH